MQEDFKLENEEESLSMIESMDYYCPINWEKFLDCIQKHKNINEEV